MKTATQALEDLMGGLKAARAGVKPVGTVTEAYDGYCKGMEGAFDIAINAIERDLRYLSEDAGYEAKRKANT